MQSRFAAAGWGGRLVAVMIVAGCVASALVAQDQKGAAEARDRLVRDHGYSLSEGQEVRRVPPPFAEARMDYYRLSNPSQAKAIPAGPSGMIFRWQGGTIENWGAVFSAPRSPGYSLEGLLDGLIDLKPQFIECPAWLRQQHLPGDWVVRPEVKHWPEQMVKQLEEILRKDFQIDAALEFREVLRPVYVARGDYQYKSIRPQKPGAERPPGNPPPIDDLEIFGDEAALDIEGGGGGSGDFGQFLEWVGRWINAPIVDETTTQPKSRSLAWSLRSSEYLTGRRSEVDRDPTAVLKNVSKQTGLTFTREDRLMRVLFVTPRPKPESTPAK